MAHSGAIGGKTYENECNVMLFGEVKNFSRPGIETEYIKKEAFKGSK